jgi:hypothetical protein
MPRIFISYSRDDRAFVDGLVPLLRELYGYDNVWFDEVLRGGQDWWDEILRQIRRCDIFCYLLSDDSLQSRYCRAELEEALRLKKHILPAKVEAQAGPLPQDLRRIHIVDLSGGISDARALSKLYAAIDRLDKPRPRLLPVALGLVAVAVAAFLVVRFALRDFFPPPGATVAATATMPDTPLPADTPTPVTPTVAPTITAAPPTALPTDTPLPSLTPVPSPNPALGIFEIDLSQSVQLLTLTIGPTEKSPTCAYHNLHLSEADVGKTLTATRLFWPEPDFGGLVLYRSLIGPWDTEIESVDIDFSPQAEAVTSEGEFSLEWVVTSAGDYVLCYNHRIHSGMPGSEYERVLEETDGSRYQVKLTGG